MFLDPDCPRRWNTWEWVTICWTEMKPVFVVIPIYSFWSSKYLYAINRLISAIKRKSCRSVSCDSSLIDEREGESIWTRDSWSTLGILPNMNVKGDGFQVVKQLVNGRVCSHNELSVIDCQEGRVSGHHAITNLLEFQDRLITSHIKVPKKWEWSRVIPWHA